ncbi:flagellar assembly peptidoglycan hydrolase FlgJ [Pseudomonas kuykendallii]|uniref:Peptidoglycan hydrolase FlgJ n=1 Tax=Pseudomonas kuykendallii TaxID=1007099 RepID=A0A2W5D396_9PSED|nr:flagellar assembly peptidoglycan hydrolase FlgJ [Pseudomonas kuykendallii]PZP26221.1 MAG: flagellar assembly peptidoglycan hydrolase FlgJ [Pseudomonas kuykendallii]
MDSRLGGNYSSNTDSGSVTDLNRLAAMKGKNRDSAENVKKVAQEFESLFLSQMMKSMRSANEVLADKDSPFSSQTSKQYQDMHDQQLAMNLSKEGGIGLAGVLERQLSHTTSGAGRKNPFAQSGDAAAVTATADKGKTQPSGAVWPSSSKKLAAVDPTRDDSKLINQRRLSLPASISQRIAAGIVPDSAEKTAAVASIAEQIGSDWKQVQQSAQTQAANPFQNRIAGLDKSAAPASISKAEAVAATSEKTRFSSKEDFIQTMLPMAEAAAKRIGVDPRYLVAQAALETGWGKHMIRQADGSSANNLFGIKSHGWKGGSVNAVTNEYVGGKEVKEVAKFRTYDSYADSFHDYVDFLQTNERYGDALKTNGNSEKFMTELQEAGYATDPRYARKVNQIARSMDTYHSIQTLASVGSGTTRI